jgi:hypothetical protein
MPRVGVLNTLGYFKYLFLTVFGKGFSDKIVNENKKGMNKVELESSQS